MNTFYIFSSEEKQLELVAELRVITARNIYFAINQVVVSVLVLFRI